MFAIRGKLTGQQRVFGALDGLKNAVRTRILRAAVRDASKVVLDAARARVPVQSGTYKKSLGRKVKTYRNSGVVVAIVGPRAGYKRTVTIKGPRGSYRTVRNPTYYAHLIEFDVKPHALGKGSKLDRKSRKGVVKKGTQSGALHPGYSGRGPLTKAWEATKEQAAQVLRDRVAREVAKL